MFYNIINICIFNINFILPIKILFARYINANAPLKGIKVVTILLSTNYLAIFSPDLFFSSSNTNNSKVLYFLASIKKDVIVLEAPKVIIYS